MRTSAGRGRTTLYRCLATPSRALGDGVRQHRLPHNTASPPVLRRPPAPERRIWTVEEAARFLTYCRQADPEMADLFEFLIGTGMRKGEALGRLRAPAPPAFTTTANQPRTGRATTLRPPWPRTHRRPPSHG